MTITLEHHLGRQLSYAAWDRVRCEQILHLQRELRVARRTAQTLAEENVALLARLTTLRAMEEVVQKEITTEMVRAQGSKLRALREELGV